MRGVVVVRGKSKWLKEGWDVAEEGEAVGDAGSWKGVRKVEKRDGKGGGNDGEAFEVGGVLAGVDLYEADKGVDSSNARIVPDDSVAGELHDGCF